MSPFGGIKDSGNGVKEGVLEAMKFFTNVNDVFDALAGIGEPIKRAALISVNLRVGSAR